jgi:hypothetical protein
VPAVQTPGVLFPPRFGLDLLAAPPARGPLVLTPSLAITEEFNDNVFLDNRNKKSDFITQFTPGLTLAMQKPGFQLTAGYNFTAEIYAEQKELSNAANRQSLAANVTYQVTPTVTLSLSDNLANNKNSNAATISGIATGRDEVWSNVLAAAVRVKVTPRTTWNVSPSYRFERFSNPQAQDSDVYAITTGLDYVVTPRFDVTTAYDFAYLDIKGEPTSYVHTFRVGGGYRLTQTLSVSASGGPSVLLSGGQTTVAPAGNASLTQTASWGSMSAFYDRAFSTSGGVGGPSENQTFGGGASVTTLMRGLSLDFAARYTMSKTEDVARRSADINVLTVSIGASYQIARYVAIVAAYSFLNQRGDSGSTRTSVNSPGASSNGVDADQNRVTFGLRFGYPISFD